MAAGNSLLRLMSSPAIIDGNGRGGTEPKEARQRRRARGADMIASYNIREGRKGGVHSAVRILKKGQLNIYVLQERLRKQNLPRGHTWDTPSGLPLPMITIVEVLVFSVARINVFRWRMRRSWNLMLSCLSWSSIRSSDGS